MTAPPNEVRAWRPRVPGVTEVFHARFTDHAYPAHTHDSWTLLIVDDGVVSYDLDRTEHGASAAMVTVLPPQVAHDGRSARTGGFRKRVVYLDPETLGSGLIGAAVDHPELADPLLRQRIDRLHLPLAQPGEEFAAQSRLELIIERLRWHLQRRPDARPQPVDLPVAGRLRELLDAHLVDGLDLHAAGRELGVGPAHLIRAFSRTYGLPPHRYLTGRRVERARRLLLDGLPVAETAAVAGFYDQAHLTRHLRRMIGTTPSRYRSAFGDLADKPL